MNLLRKTFRLSQLLLLYAALPSCSSLLESAPDCDYIPDFHESIVSSSEKQKGIVGDDMSLYVDYSTCITLGQHSSFFQSLIPSFVTATKHYYSIKGPDIKEETNINVFHALSNIQEVNYADLKKAANMIVSSDSEGVLLTDGEYYQRNIAGGGISDPYLAEPFKIWLTKGHDIYIMSEPYIEGSQQYKKKRFYFMFTDSRLEGNIYQRIVNTTKLEDFPEVEIFHLSASHPMVMAENGKLKINANLSSSTEQRGNFEIQKWPIDWGSIENIMRAADVETGEPLEYGETVFGGLKVDRNSYGGFRICDISLKVYDINADYCNFYLAKNESNQNSSIDVNWIEAPNSFMFDKDEFEKHGIINVHFDVPLWNPGFLTAQPFNYTMIDIRVADVENVFSNYEDIFNFDAIGLPGKYNTSVTESVKQALFDPEIQKMMKSAHLYTVYLQTPKY